MIMHCSFALFSLFSQLLVYLVYLVIPPSCDILPTSQREAKLIEVYVVLLLVSKSVFRAFLNKVADKT